MPLTPSLSPSDGERVSVGRVRGISTNILRFISLILIVNWNEHGRVHYKAQGRTCDDCARFSLSPSDGERESLPYCSLSHRLLSKIRSVLTPA
jgi:hypothetical protein